jgi:uridine phosphorylase
MSPESPLLQNKHYQTAPVFSPANLLREARRQKSLPNGDVPRVCVLDPDGDIVAHLLREKLAKRNPYWACYHTVLYQFEIGGILCGIIGCAVGGSFAVLLAEQLFESGCRLLIGVTSAGQILPVRIPPYFVLIEKALRDEGTSHHYLPPERYAQLSHDLSALLTTALKPFVPSIEHGAAWTTDAPYRETAEAISYGQKEGILAVEMEAASLYAFAQANQKPVVCFAHITNRMGVDQGDFEKGEADGSVESLRLIEAVARSWTSRPVSREGGSEVHPVKSRETSESKEASA